jgi:PKD repeat protein
MILVLSGTVPNPAALGAPGGWGGVVPQNLDRARHLAVSASATPATGTAPLFVTFHSNLEAGVAPFASAWSFGDGTGSSGTAPSHTYNVAGVYTVQLTVTDARHSTYATTIRIAASAATQGSAVATLVTGSLVARTPGTFWSVDAQTSCATCISSSSAVTSYLSSTPFTWVRYGQGIDSCNISVDKSYSASGVASSGCGFDLSSLKSWCASTTPHCHAILSLPGENNNSGEDAAIAKWIVGAVGFHPDYWSIGNEPTGWTHYGIAWTSWKSTDAAKPTPLAYAWDVKAAIAAVSAVDPAAKFIGIEAACSCNTAWFQDVATVDGTKMSAVAVHNYPSTGSTQESLSQFYAPLTGSSNVSSSVAAVRSAIRGYCSGCANLPIFVNEYNAGPGWAPSNHSGTYANAVFLAASVTQALTSNVTQLTVFNLESSALSGYGYALLDRHGTKGPSGTLFSGVLDHMARGAVFADHVRTTVGNVWAVTTTDANTESVLVVNANLTRSISLSLGWNLLTAVTASVVHWDPTMSGPVGALLALAKNYTIPPQGILLVNVPRSVFLLGPMTFASTAGPSTCVATPAPAPCGSPASVPLLAVRSPVVPA